MLAEFEKQQLETGDFLTTDERIQKENEYLQSIGDEFGEKIKREIHLRPELIAFTDKDNYEFVLSKATGKCKEILTKYLYSGCGYRFDLPYEENMHIFTDVVLAQIKNTLTNSSRYVTSRSDAYYQGIAEAILNAAKQWFLTPEECKQLKDAGYWSQH